MKNVMALVDCDSFFCSCEKIFRPDLKKKPVIVLSNNDGCVISRNREAKSLGIQMGVPYFKVKSFCQKHKVAIFSSNFSLYTEVSKRIINILKTFSSNVEVYSIDEAFIDLTGVSNPHQFSLEIKKTVEQFTKVPVSIGVAPTKGLTKAACFIAKKDLSFNGVVSLLTQEDQKEALKQMPINKLWGVSKGREARLIFMGIKTALDFRDFENQALIKKTLTKVGLQIQDELRGVSCFPIGETQQKKKEVMSSRSFGKPVYDLKTLREIAANHAHEVAEE
ncbi:MAG: Y-family DNA polymerase, partial [Bacteriovoracaceae bacterium]